MCKEALKNVTLMDGLTVVIHNGKTATIYRHWMLRVLNFSSKLRMWGEAVVIKE